MTMTNNQIEQIEQIDQSEINNILWAACDTFRGTVDPSQYKDYILVMLFVKYISDVWNERVAAYRQQYDGDEERVQRRLAREKFVIPAGSTFDALYAQRNDEALGEIIDKALDALELANVEKLEGVFRNISYNSEPNLGRVKERNKRLKNLLNDFNNPKLDMRPSRIGDLDVIGNAYEYLIGEFASGAGKKAGEFYTPPAVSTLLARLVAPRPGERIYDPTCGSASLLIKCAEQVGSSDYAIYGQENNGQTWALAKMNMFLHEIHGADLRRGDTIGEPQHTDPTSGNTRLMSFEVVVANPPFSLDKWGADGAADDPHKRFWRGVPPKSKGDYAFITHMIEVMDGTHGRAGVIVPHGVLFRGSSEGKIRKQLVAENLLDAVIGLPPGLFYGTGIPAAILLFRRGKTDNSVLFIDASRDFEAGTKQNVLRDSDLDHIEATYRARQSVEKYAERVTQADIIENDYNLNIPRYVDTFEEEEPLDLKEIELHLTQIKEKLFYTDNKLQSFLHELGVAND